MKKSVQSRNAVKSTIPFHTRWRQSRAHWGGSSLVGTEKRYIKKKRKNGSKKQSKVAALGMRRRVAKQQRAERTLALLPICSQLSTRVPRVRQRPASHRKASLVFIYSRVLSDMLVFTQFNKPPVCDNANTVTLLVYETLRHTLLVYETLSYTVCDDANTVTLRSSGIMIESRVRFL